MKKLIIIVITIGIILAIIIPLGACWLDRNKITIPSSLVNENKTEDEIEAEESNKRADERDNKMINVIRKFYPEEVDPIVKKLRGEETDHSTYEDAQIEWLELTLKVIEEEETEKLTSEEKTILKNYLEGEYSLVKEINDYSLMERVERAIEKLEAN